MPKQFPADTWSNLFYPPANYQYFENADQFDFEPDAAGFSWHNAWWLADAALLAYVKDWNLAKASLDRARLGDSQQVGPNPSTSTKGFFAWRSGPVAFAILAFRGTDKDDPRNTKSDEDTIPIERDGYVVHQGFALALDQVWDEVKLMLDDFRRRFPDAPVYFTGHSLGAALATLAVARFEGNTCALYTFGSPRVGDDRFIGAVLQKAKMVFRFVNSQDIVTQIPPQVPLQHYFRHVGAEKYIDRKGVVRDDPSKFLKFTDMAHGIIAHDGLAALKEIGHPADFFSRIRKTEPWVVDPPPYIVGNHTPARYSIRIWNYYSGI
jgi:hypothetical protein